MGARRAADGELQLGGVTLGELAAASRYHTPTYVYDLGGMASEAAALRSAFEGAPHVVAYAVKANSAGPVVRTLREAGCGADVVSGAELSLALACGVAADAIVFSGVAKRDDEIDQAIAAGILALQIESVEEIERVAARARGLGRSANVSLRVNPEASLQALATHAHVATGHDEAKFGVPLADVALALARVRAEPRLSLVGLSSHVGSQLTSTGAYVASARALFDLAANERSASPSLRFVDTGGGFGVDYGDGCDRSPADFARETRALQRAMRLGDLALVVEPGRSLVAAHGVLLARVIQAKVTPAKPTEAARRRWLMIDAGMNDLVRPALYQARHRIVPLALGGGAGAGALVEFRVVGPVCESSDDFGEHLLPADPPARVAILDAGAYGYTMASRYNGRALPAEVFVRDGVVVAAREREPAEGWVRERVSIGG